MAVRVLVVDDSRFFRRRVTEMLESDARIKVIGHAENGAATAFGLIASKAKIAELFVDRLPTSS